MLNKALFAASPSLIMCDLDHFKRVNDQYGHPAGNHVLRFFAAQIRRSARESDINCRYGGEEFLIVLPGMARREAIQRAELLRQRIAETPIDFHSKRISLTASFGIASAPENGTDAEILIAAADQALYAAKNAGRNRVADCPASAVNPKNTRFRPNGKNAAFSG